MSTVNPTSKTYKTVRSDVIISAVIYVLSFILPVMILALALYMCNISPNGANTILTYDLEYELLPYYSYLSRLGCGFNNLFYSTTQGLGGNFLGIFAFELSPLDMIYSFIPVRLLPQAIYFMIIFKIGLSGLFCSIFLTKGRIKVSALWAVTFSCCYALMSYSIIYTSWPTFQDAVIMLPILALCLDRIISGKKSTLFVISVTYAMISCYYTAYMLVIALIPYFLFRIIEEKYDLKTAANRLFGFMIHGILSAGISMFLILPVVSDLGRGKLSDEEAIIHSSFVKFSPLSVLGHFIPGSYSNLGNNQLPNIFCSSLILVFAVIYLLKKDGIRLIIARWSIILIYFCSFILSPLDRIWHGFKNPAGYSCRYAFTFVFFLLCFAIRGMEHLKNREIKLSEIAKHFAIMFAFIYTFFELIGNTRTIIARIDDEYLYCSRAQYDMYVDTVNGCLDIIDSEQNTPYYRMSKNFSFTTADDMFFGYNDVEYLGSSYNGNLVRFCRETGLYSIYAVINSTGLTPPMADLIGSEYFLSYGPDMNDYFTRIGEYGSVIIYRNENALPLAFVMEKATDEGIMDMSQDKFENINSVYSDICGDGIDPVFEKTDFEVLSFETSEQTGTNILTVKFTTGKEGHYWLYIDSQYDNSYDSGYSGILYYSLDDEYGGMIGEADRRFCSDIGNLGPDEDHVLSINVGTSIGANIYLYYLNTENLNTICSSVNGFDVVENSSDGMRLTGNAKTGDKLFISLPYEKGYRITLNGQKAAYDSYRDTFLMLNLQEGKNDIEIKFRPYGLTAGLIISVISIIISLLYLTGFGRKRNEAGTKTQATE